MLSASEASVNNLLRRARAAFESRLPATGRERAPLPHSKLEREIVGRFAEHVEEGDIDGMVALLTDDAWVTMPPLPHAYQGRDAIGAFLRGSSERRGAPMRLVPTRANTQPAFGSYVAAPGTQTASAYGLSCSRSSAARSRRSPDSRTAAVLLGSACHRHFPDVVQRDATAAVRALRVSAETFAPPLAVSSPPVWCSS
jgi:hypothetical protein